MSFSSILERRFCPTLRIQRKVKKKKNNNRCVVLEQTRRVNDDGPRTTIRAFRTICRRQCFTLNAVEHAYPGPLILRVGETINDQDPYVYLQYAVFFFHSIVHCSKNNVFVLARSPFALVNPWRFRLRGRRRLRSLFIFEWNLDSIFAFFFSFSVPTNRAQSGIIYHTYLLESACTDPLWAMALRFRVMQFCVLQFLHCTCCSEDLTSVTRGVQLFICIQTSITPDVFQ